MLTRRQKKEMLLDAKNARRKNDLASSSAKRADRCSLDEYLEFLDDVQKVFRPFKISTEPTVTKYNKL